MEGFDIVDNTLKVSVDLDLEAEEGFKGACDKLLAAEGDPLYLDLSEVGFVGSSFFGQMFMLNYRIKKENRALVIRTPKHLMSIMELLGLPQLIDIEIVDSQPQTAPSDESVG